MMGEMKGLGLEVVSNWFRISEVGVFRAVRDKYRGRLPKARRAHFAVRICRCRRSEVESTRGPEVHTAMLLSGSRLPPCAPAKNPIVFNVYDYVRNAEIGRGTIVETAKAVGLCRQVVSKIVARGPKTPKKKGNKNPKFGKIDDFTCDVVRREVYTFFKKGHSPTVAEVLSEVKRVCHFPYEATNMRGIIKRLGFHFRTLNKRRVIMESSRIVAWRYKYLNRLNQLRSAGYRIIFLDETWYDTHDVVKKGWDDGSCCCCLQSPVSRAKRIMILHAGSTEGWVTNCLYLSSKNIRDSLADSHDEMNADIFERWFENSLLPNIRDKKCAIVVDNASYHSRLKVKIPTMSSKKDDIIRFMSEHNLDIPNPVPIKAVMLEIVKAANIEKKIVIDEMAENDGHEVLRLPPYHCNLNPIELIWASLKRAARKKNVTPPISDSVCKILRECVKDIDENLWGKCVQKTTKIEKHYVLQDTLNENSRFIINVGGSDSDSEDDD